MPADEIEGKKERGEECPFPDVGSELLELVLSPENDAHADCAADETVESCDVGRDVGELHHDGREADDDGTYDQPGHGRTTDSFSPRVMPVS